MYRFRSIKSLLGERNELEKQEIHFSPLDKLNDPLEGILDFYWQGDDIVWKKFFNHYLLSLHQSLFDIFILEKNQINIIENSVTLFLSEDKILDKQSKELFSLCQNKFFSQKVIINIIQLLANMDRKIMREELILILKIIHIFALMSMFSVFPNFELSIKERYNSIIENCNEHVDELISYIKEAIEEYQDYKDFKGFNNLMEFIYIDQMKLRIDISLFIINEFTIKYINNLREMVFPKWYVACFLNSYKNVAIWTHYCEQHQGVCLIFKDRIENGHRLININKNDMILDKVNYEDDFVKIDFFRSIYRKLNKEDLFNNWYKDDDGKVSTCSEWLQDENFVKEYMGNLEKDFRKACTTKLKFWSNEDEYRIILDDIHANEPIKLSYDFNDLEGIIFGIRTKLKDKLRIKKIIERKMKSFNRKDFNFYQVRFDLIKKEMVLDPVFD